MRSPVTFWVRWCISLCVIIWSGRTWANFRFRGIAAFWPVLCLLWSRRRNLPRPSGAHCQPTWHHHIYFYSLQMDLSLYPYWHIPRLRGAWLHPGAQEFSLLAAGDKSEGKRGREANQRQTSSNVFVLFKNDIKYKWLFIFRHNNSCVTLISGIKTSG